MYSPGGVDKVQKQVLEGQGRDAASIRDILQHAETETTAIPLSKIAVWTDVRGHPAIEKSSPIVTVTRCLEK